MATGKETYTLYKIYYEGDNLVYLGRTKQPLTDRLRGHVFKNPTLRVIDIDVVEKIEYAEFKTEADMFLYEIYFINLYKPSLNCDDKASDELTVALPDVEFKIWTSPLWDTWKKEVHEKEEKENREKIEKAAKEYDWKKRTGELRQKLESNMISDEQYFKENEEIEKEKIRFQYQNHEIDFKSYCKKMGFTKIN